MQFGTNDAALTAEIIQHRMTGNMIQYIQKKFEDGGHHVSQDTTGGTEENLKKSSHKAGLPKGSITLGEFTSYSLANLLAATKFALCNNVVL